MKPCTRVGIDVTWRCQWECKTCFYLRNPKFRKPIDVPVEEVKAKIDRAKAGGLDHVVAVGYGEPSLCPNMPEIIDYSHSLGMATSIITNGAAGLKRYKGYFDQGLDHLHISSHGLNNTLDEIAGAKGAFIKQTELKTWLESEGLPFRTNVTMQQLNYRELPELTAHELAMGVYHFVYLGFLPHYEWHEHLADVAVHPAKLRPYIEEGAELLLEKGVMFTIRYHPLCQLSPKFWPYVVNARYVAYDPGEWCYTLQVHDAQALWKASVECGESVACHDPCDECLAYPYCGGWNWKNIAAFPGCVKPIREIPREYQAVWDKRGGLHDLNPFNHISCTLRKPPLQ